MQSSVRFQQARLIAADAVLAVAAMVLIAVGSLEPPAQLQAAPIGIAWLAAACCALPVAVRRRSPWVVLSVVLTAGALTTALGLVGAGVLWAPYVPAALTLYLVALRSAWPWSLAALPACLAISAFAIFLYYVRITPALVSTGGRPEQQLTWSGDTAVAWLVLAAAWGIGTLIRWRRYLNDRLAQQLAREAVVDERLRIARELHDIVGHSMSLIAVKATVANHLADVRPEETRAALAVIEQTSRTALTDIRRVLGILRNDEGAFAGARAELAPVFGLTDLRDLADRAESAGVAVDLVVRSAGPLPEAMELSIYRIVQEALTNAITHAAPTHCRVDVDADEHGVHVEVTDDGPSQPRTAPRPSGGLGLIGINERVTMYGGTFAAGPRTEGGFRLSAHLPCEAA